MQKIQETPQTKNQDKEQVQNCAKRKVNTKKKKKSQLQSCTQITIRKCNFLKLVFKWQSNL